MEILKWQEKKEPKISFILFDWSVRESFHILDYFFEQTIPREQFEIIWIEFYNRRPEGLKVKQTMLDKWIILEYPESIIYHKHLMYNIGAIVSSSPILCIPDSDAFFKPTFIESILKEFEKDRNIVLYLDECRNEDPKYYPFSYPDFDLIQNPEECWNWPKDPEKVKVDPIHILNYGACMSVTKKHYIEACGVDEDLEYLGYIAGPHELGFRLVNCELREVWHPTEFLYHTCHPGQGGDKEPKGHHDGFNMSSLALEVKEKEIVSPRVENKGIEFLRKNPNWIGDKREVLKIAFPDITESWLRKDNSITGVPSGYSRYMRAKICKYYHKQLEEKKSMKLSDYVIQYLVEQGIERIFCIYGAHNADLIDSIAKNPKIDYVCVHHEQAGAMAVDGYYRASGRPSAMIATSGPGGTNLITGICCSWYDSIPTLFITGQVSTSFLRPRDTLNTLRQTGFQENDIVRQVNGITKFAYQLRNPNIIETILDQAFYHMLEGRPGPVLIDIPQDIQKKEVDLEAAKSYIFNKESFSNKLPINKIKEVVKLLKKAKRPALLLGGGIHLSKAESLVQTLIHTLKIPTFLTYNALDLLPVDDPNYGGRVGTFGGAGRNFGIQNCDFLLCIGTRISGRITGGLVSTFARAAKIVVVDIDPHELRNSKGIRRDLSIECDAGTFIRLLLEELPISLIFQPLPIEKWRDRVIQWREKYCPSPDYWPYEFIRTLSLAVDENEIIVFSAGGALVWCSQAWITKKGQRIFTDNGHSSLGYTLPAAIGAAIAYGGQKRIIAICGDGDLMFNLQELQTLKNYNLPIKLFILNNQCYGIAKNYQDTYFESRYEASGRGYSIPNLREIVKAFNLDYYWINENDCWAHYQIGKFPYRPGKYNENEMTPPILDCFDVGLRRILSYDHDPAIIDVDMKDMHKYEPHLGWGLPIEMQLPLLPKEEFLENMIIPPVEGWERVYESHKL